jgi:hypothetical protein
MAEIDKDARRTFPHLHFFNHDGSAGIDWFTHSLSDSRVCHSMQSTDEIIVLDFTCCRKYPAL